MKKTLASLLLASLLVSIIVSCLSGCAAVVPGSNQYPATTTNSVVHVSYGNIVSLREVEVKEKTSGVGSVAGGLAGAAIGSQVGSGKGSVLAVLAGGLAGIIGGQAIERGLSNSKAVEIVLKMEDTGSTISITQKTDEKFVVGQRVQLIGTDKNNARVTAVAANQ